MAEIATIRAQADALERLMQDVKREVLALRARADNLDKENDRLRKVNHEAEVMRRALKWMMAGAVVYWDNGVFYHADSDHLAAPPRWSLPKMPDEIKKVLSAIAQEIDLEAEHAG